MVRCISLFGIHIIVDYDHKSWYFTSCNNNEYVLPNRVLCQLRWVEHVGKLLPISRGQYSIVTDLRTPPRRRHHDRVVKNVHNPKPTFRAACPLRFMNVIGRRMPTDFPFIETEQYSPCRIRFDSTTRHARYVRESERGQRRGAISDSAAYRRCHIPGYGISRSIPPGVTVRSTFHFFEKQTPAPSKEHVCFMTNLDICPREYFRCHQKSTIVF